MTPPSIDAPAAGELWDLLKTGRRFRALGQKDGYPAAALGADGGRRSRRRVVRDRSAAGRRSRRAGSSAPRRDRGPPGTGAVLLLNAAIDPVARRQQRHGQGGPGRADARDGRGRARGGRGDPHRRRGRARQRPRRTRHGRRSLEDGTEIPATRGGLECRSAPDVPDARRSGRARSRLPDEDPQLPRVPARSRR